ncbi:hypothetical protein [Streptomyces viridochromogenes]|uniref:hypothetical protein n=1 Tax=Streptomyces viridochromogenes TaxID=1938 RepID=UPI001180A65E|nr:hypothetical protein [Streptomyces viridochromogenes]
MKVRTVGQPDEVFYFAWAVENLYSTQGLVQFLDFASFSIEDQVDHARLMIGKALEAETVPAPRLAEEAGEPVSSTPWWIPQADSGGMLPFAHMRYMDLLGATPDSLLRNREDQFGADERDYTPQLDHAAYRLMLTSFLSALSGEKNSVPWLGVLLLRGPTNRQLCIAHFMPLVTHGSIGSNEQGIPSLSSISSWASATLHFHEPVRPRLPFSDIVRRYIELSRKGGVRESG